MKDLKPVGGNDFCEDLREALKQACDYKWLPDQESNHKFLFVVTDYPSHGTRYHGSNSSKFKNYDLYPNDCDLPENCEYYLK